jgi:hypothetical protein
VCRKLCSGSVAPTGLAESYLPFSQGCASPPLRRRPVAGDPASLALGYPPRLPTGTNRALYRRNSHPAWLRMPKVSGVFCEVGCMRSHPSHKKSPRRHVARMGHPIDYPGNAGPSAPLHPSDEDLSPGTPCLKSASLRMTASMGGFMLLH